MYYLNLVNKFQDLAQVETPLSPIMPKVKDYELRLSLIKEELNELIDGYYKDNLEECLDALCDLKYVVCGTILTFGYKNLVDDDTLIKLQANKPNIPNNTLFNKDLGMFRQHLINLEFHLVSEQTEKLRDDLYNLIIAIDDLISIFGFGFVFKEAFTTVHKSNMFKAIDGKLERREDGKIIKPFGWQKPNLKKYIWGE